MEKEVWYYRIGGKKMGPLSHKEVQEKLESGAITSSTEVWTKGLQEWLPITEVEHFNMTTLDETPTVTVEKQGGYDRETDGERTHPRPWVRFWARMVDYSLLATLVVFFYKEVTSILLIGVICTFVWALIEAFLLATWGTTPGKWILKVVVRNEEGKKLALSDSIKRSLSVWLLGVGGALPIVSTIAMIIAAAYLKRFNTTPWDKRCKSVVLHGRVGVLRTVFVALYLLYILLPPILVALQLARQQ